MPGTRKGQAVAVTPLKRQQPALWGYGAAPGKQDHGWYENEVGRIVRLGRAAPPADGEATQTAWPLRRD